MGQEAWGGLGRHGGDECHHARSPPVLPWTRRQGPGATMPIAGGRRSRHRSPTAPSTRAAAPTVRPAIRDPVSAVARAKKNGTAWRRTRERERRSRSRRGARGPPVARRGVDRRRDLDADQRRERDSEDDRRTGGVVVVGSLAGVPADWQGHDPTRAGSSRTTWVIHRTDSRAARSRSPAAMATATHARAISEARTASVSDPAAEQTASPAAPASLAAWTATIAAAAKAHSRRGRSTTRCVRKACSSITPRASGRAVDDDEQQPAEAQGARQRRREVAHAVRRPR